MPTGNMSESQSPSGQDRVIRVFISSTFRDMQKERELLIKKVFPELHRVCDERFVAFTEVDLRWGITQEQAAEGRVLPICLEEINRSRPYFIGLLGERYGWIPNTVAREVLAKEPWLKEHVGGRTSVTELEILHGVLRNPKQAGHTFFYFRDPAYIATLPESEQSEMVERDIPDDIAALGASQAAIRTQERKDKLRNLKDRIRRSGMPLLDNYPNPEALAAAIRQQFLDLIDQLYPKDQVPHPLDQEAIGHRTYARRKLLAYVDRPTHSKALSSFVQGPHTGQGLVVTGDSGSGKTALLADWVTQWRQDHPDYFVFEHYFGATPESASVDGFLRRLLGELKRLADIPEEIPATPEKMREVLPLWLAQTVGRKPIVLVLDALNQIQGDEPDRHLNWLPRSFPPHVRVIASSLRGLALDTLAQRGWSEHRLPLTDATERGQMIDAFLGEYRKKLGQKLRDQIVSAPGSANPLFLRTVLEELRQFGSFDDLPQQVALYLQATTPEALFRQVIHRWQGDFHAGREVVSRSLRHLWASRQGLSDGEWLDLLVDEKGPMDRQTWRPLLLAMEPHLVQRGSLWAFGHDFLRQAVEAEFLSTAQEKNAAHLAIADYFGQHERQREMTPRKAAEWPFQLHAAAAWDRLEACLTDIPLFLALYNAKTKWELTGYWHPLRKRGRDMGVRYTAAYAEWIADPARAGDPYVPADLGQFLSDNGLYPPAEPLLRRALAAYERVLGAEHPSTLGSVNNLAYLLERKGDYAGAQPLYERALAASERVLGPEHPSTLGSVNNLASLLVSKGDYAGAQPLHERALAARERVLGPEHPDTLRSVDNLASLLASKGDFAGAQPLCERALAARERVLGPEHPDTLESVNNLAVLLWSKGDYVGAHPLCERALAGLLKISQAIQRPHPNLQAFIVNYAGCLAKLGRSPEQIRSTLAGLGRRYGFDLAGAAGLGQADPSAQLRQNHASKLAPPKKPWWRVW